MAEITGGELKYVATLDTSQLDQSLKDSEGNLRGFSEVAESMGETLDGAISATIAEEIKKIGLESNLTGKELKDAIANAKEFAKGMEQGLSEAVQISKELAKEIDALGEGPSKDAMVKEWQNINNEIDDAALGVEAVKKHIEDVKFASAPLQTQFRRAKEEMEQLVLQGEKGSPRYKALTGEAEKLKKAMEDVATELKLATDPTGMQGFISVATTATSVLSVAAGVYGIFGEQNEKIKAVTEKVNSIMAIAIGLQGVATQGTQAYTAVTNFLSIAQGRLAVALGISNVAARVLLATLSLGLAVAIPLLVGYFSNLIEKQKESTRAQNELSDAMKEGNATVAKEIGELDRLYITATNVTLSMRQRLAAVEALKKSYPGHFSQIENEIILNGKAEASYLAVRDAIFQAARARAAQVIIDKRTEDLLNKQEDARGQVFALMMQNKKLESAISSGRNDSPVLSTQHGYGITMQEDQDQKAKETIARNKKAITDIARGITKDVDDYNSNNKRLVKIIQDGSAAMFEATTPTETKTPSVGIKPIKNSTATPEKDIEEILQPGSLAALRKELSQIQSDFEATNDQMTRDILNTRAQVVQSEIDMIKSRYNVEEDENAKALEQFIAAHLSFEQQRAKITQQYATIREGIEKSTTLSSDEKVRLKDEATKAEGKAISDAFLTGMRDNPEWAEAFGRLETYTLEKLKSLREKLVTELSRMQGSGATPTDIKTVQDQIIKIDDLVNKTDNPFRIISNGLRDLGDESLSTSEKIAKAREIFAAFSSGLSDIKDIVDSVNGIFMYLGGEADSAFGDIVSSIEKTIAGLEQFGEGALQAFEGFASGNMLQAAAGAIKAIAGAVKAVSAWMSGDNRIERQIQKQAQALRELEEAYSNLAFAAERAIGAQKYDSQRELIQSLQQQKAVLDSMARSESSKKKSDKTKIEDYKSQINAINQSIIELQEGIIRDVLQTDVVDAAQKVGDALVDAFGRGEDAAKSLEVVANDLLKNLIRNQLNLALQNRMKPIIDQLLAASGFSEDGTGTFTGLSEDMIKQFKEQVAAAGLSMQGFLDGYKDIFGNLEDNVSQGMKGDIKGITEKTAGVLEAQINAMRINQATSTNIVREILIVLVTIEVNTRRLHNIDKTLVEMNAKITKPLAGL